MRWRQLLARQPLEHSQGHGHLLRVLGPVALTAIGIGATIGSGIFVTTGEVARNTAGPGVLVSYLIAGFACMLAALCYAEFAALAPTAGSAYSYAYATLGEFLAWVIGWDLVLEYAVAGAIVAVGWSEYFVKLLDLFGVHVPKQITSDPFTTEGSWFN